MATNKDMLLAAASMLMEEFTEDGTIEVIDLVETILQTTRIEGYVTDVIPTEPFSLHTKPYVAKERAAKPAFVLPLKDHAARRGNDCTMSCAFTGSPAPTATWYRSDVKVSDGPRLWQNTRDGVCTLTIPACTAKDSGEYVLVLENPLGEAKCKCNLVIFDKDDRSLLESLTESSGKEKHIM